MFGHPCLEPIEIGLAVLGQRDSDHDLRKITDPLKRDIPVIAPDQTRRLEPVKPRPTWRG